MTDAAPTTEQAQPEAAATASTPAVTDQGTQEKDQRIRGLDAKVTTLQRERDELAAKVTALQSGQINAEESLKAQLVARDTELAELRVKAAAVPLMQQYPRVAKELGDRIGTIPEEALASLEAQLNQAAPVADATPPKPTPIPVNAPDADGDSLANMSREQILDQMRRAPSPFSD